MTDQKSATQPIKLYWWNDEPNFGDALSPLLVGYASGRPVEWALNSECEIFSLGSIMKQARRGFHKNSGKDYKPYIWGTGMIGPQRLDFLEQVQFAAVRGPATAALLGINKYVFGDPGLLVCDLVKEQTQRSDDIGIIPHHGQFANEKTKAALDHLAKLPNVKIIDVRNNDALAVVREIQSCRHVFSESLHGLIVADSLGIPNTWLKGGTIHGSPLFKFCDYFLSIGRKFEPPIGYEEIEGALLHIHKSPKMDYLGQIEIVKSELLDAFPAELKA